MTCHLDPVPSPDGGIDAVIDIRDDRPPLGAVALPERTPYRHHYVKIAVVALDAAAITAAVLLAYALRRLGAGAVAEHSDRHLLVAGATVPVWLAIFSRYRLYAGLGVSTRPQEFRQLVHASAAGVVAMTAISFALGAVVPRGWLALTFPVTLATMLLEREAIRRGFHVLRRQGRLSRRTLIVGTNAEGCSLSRALLADPSLGRSVVGFVDDNATASGDLPDGMAILGRVGDVAEISLRTGADSVLVAVTAVTSEVANRLARELTESGFHVELSSGLRDIAVERLSVRRLGRFPVVHVAPVHRNGWRAVAKRTFDLVVATGGLVLSAPLLGTIALAIKLDSPGPVLFRQQRVGRDGVPFDMLKFRTMVVDAEARLIDLTEIGEDGTLPLFKLRRDPRVTRVGRLLRKFSLDELPQLWNVLQGEMGLVGPRPALPAEIAQWGPELLHRLRVAPGITGIWQVSGRSDLPFEDYVRLDRYYVDNWSLWTDLAILAKTIPTVIFCRGAY